MTLAPDERAWEVSYKKVDGMWFADFMFVDLDRIMVSMFVHCDGKFELRFNTKGSGYFMMAEAEMRLLNCCVEEQLYRELFHLLREAQETLILLEEQDAFGAS